MYQQPMLNHNEFITTYTRLQYLSFVPEIRLFLRDDRLLHAILQQELGNDTPSPEWAYSWAGGQALSRYVLDNKHIVKDKHVVDFCSGSGIVGIAAALSGAASVTCVDIDPFALSASLLNARANKVQLSVSETLVDADVILSGDPTVQEHLYDKLRTTNDYVGCPVRNKEYMKGFDVVSQYNIKTHEFVDGTIVYIINNRNQ